MARRSQLRLFFHGTIFILASMMVGLPGFILAVDKELADYTRQFVRQSHAILMSSGIWLVASGGVLPLLDLTQRSMSQLVWFLIAGGYLFLASIPVLAIALPLKPPPPWSVNVAQWDQLKGVPYHLGIVFMALLGISSLSFLFGAIVTLLGAGKALRQSIADSVR
jgi:hypothetical protein